MLLLLKSSVASKHQEAEVARGQHSTMGQLSLVLINEPKAAEEEDNTLTVAVLFFVGVVAVVVMVVSSSSSNTFPIRPRHNVLRLLPELTYQLNLVAGVKEG